MTCPKDVANWNGSRNKLGKIMAIYLEWGVFHRNFASDLRFIQKLVFSFSYCYFGLG